MNEKPIKRIEALKPFSRDCKRPQNSAVLN